MKFTIECNSLSELFDELAKHNKKEVSDCEVSSAQTVENDEVEKDVVEAPVKKTRKPKVDAVATMIAEKPEGFTNIGHITEDSEEELAANVAKQNIAASTSQDPEEVAQGDLKSYEDVSTATLKLIRKKGKDSAVAILTDNFNVSSAQKLKQEDYAKCIDLMNAALAA